MVLSIVELLSTAILLSSTNLCQLPSQEQPFPASWFPWTAWAPPDQRAPPAGLQRAPCGCFFNPQLFSMQWTVPNLPPTETSTLGYGAAALPGAALLGPGGCGTLLAWAAPGTPQGPAQHLAPQNHQGTGAVVPATPALPEPRPGNQHTEGVPAGNNISSTNTSMGIAPGNNIPPGSNILLDPSSDHQNPGLGKPDEDTEVTEEMLLKEALRLFGMSEEMEAVIQHGPGSATMSEDPGVTVTNGRTLAPATPDLPNSIPVYENIEGVSAGIRISNMAMSAGTPPGSNVPIGSNILLDPSADHQNPGLGEPDGDIEVTQEMLLKEALRLFGMSEEMEAVIQHGPGSITSPEDCGDTIGKGRTLAPAAPDLLNSIPSKKNIEGVSAEPNIPSTATSVGTTLGINIPPGNDVPPSLSSDPHHQSFGDLNDSLEHYKDVPLEEALRFFGCFEDTERVIQEGPSSSPMPEDPAGTGTDIPLYDFTSLSLPDELLTCDYDVNEIAKVIQSLEDINTGKYPHGFWADAGMDLELSQPDGAEQWATK